MPSYVHFLARQLSCKCLDNVNSIRLLMLYRKQLNSYDSYRKLANLCHNILGIPARWFLYINTNVQTSSLNADVYVQADKVSQEKTEETCTGPQYGILKDDGLPTQINAY